MIQHDASAPAGYLGKWLSERGADVDVLHVYADERVPDPGAYDLVVPLGSDQHAYDDGVPWLPRELALLQRAVEHEVPTFGICFGGQLLARVLGGSVQPAPAAEIGWFDVRTTDADLIGPGPWFQWHYDSFTPPAGATVVAESAVGPQAFVRDRVIGLQFHPEVDQTIVGMWAEESPDSLTRAGLDPAALVRQTGARDPQSRAAAWRLFDAVFSRLTADGNERR